MAIERFEDIEAWREARGYTKAIYEATRTERFRTDYALRDQITRAAGSIMHNIAEGFDAGSNREFVRFLRYALRSATESKSALYIALDQSYLDDESFRKLYAQATRIQKLIFGFIRYLNGMQPSS